MYIDGRKIDHDVACVWLMWTSFRLRYWVQIGPCLRLEMQQGTCFEARNEQEQRELPLLVARLELAAAAAAAFDGLLAWLVVTKGSR